MNDKTPVRAQDGGIAELLLSHLDSAYNLARWLVRNSADAEDVVQEAYLRAFQYCGGFRGGDARAWLLTIVRNTSYRWLRKARSYELGTQFDENEHACGSQTSNPEVLLLQKADKQLLEKTLNELPVRFREILVLRELEGLAYKEIAEVMGMPMGTVMSTLSRARHEFSRAAGEILKTESRSQFDAYGLIVEFARNRAAERRNA
jgi:RNA polymerase sigma-70 factor, ECF subfamily